MQDIFDHSCVDKADYAHAVHIIICIWIIAAGNNSMIQ